MSIRLMLAFSKSKWCCFKEPLKCLGVTQGINGIPHLSTPSNLRGNFGMQPLGFSQFPRFKYGPRAKQSPIFGEQNTWVERAQRKAGGKFSQRRLGLQKFTPRNSGRTGSHRKSVQTSQAQSYRSEDREKPFYESGRDKSKSFGDRAKSRPEYAAKKFSSRENEGHDHRKNERPRKKTFYEDEGREILTREKWKKPIPNDFQDYEERTEKRAKRTSYNDRPRQNNFGHDRQNFHQKNDGQYNSRIKELEEQVARLNDSMSQDDVSIPCNPGRKQTEKRVKGTSEPKRDLKDKRPVDPKKIQENQKKSTVKVPEPPIQIEEGADFATLVIKKGKSRLFYEGSPIVYQGNVEKIIAPTQPSSGQAMRLVDSNMQEIGWGVYNSKSMFRLRILRFKKEQESDAEPFSIEKAIKRQITEAKDLRTQICLPSEKTTAYRLINSEGDKLSGVSIDIYNQTAVVSSTCLWAEQNRGTIENSLKEIIGVSELVEEGDEAEKSVQDDSAEEIVEEESDLSSSENKEEANIEIEANQEAKGVRVEEISEQGKIEAEENPGAEAKREGKETEEEGEELEDQAEEEESISSKRNPSYVIVLEDSVKYKTDLIHGQKTGFYTDQRDSRLFMKGLSKGKTVLDLCCYTGGFALACAVGGAQSVTGIDSSKKAIRLAKENAELNECSSSTEFQAQTIESYLREAIDAEKEWDVVILDPPKFAPSKSALPRATRKYKSLNMLALKLVKPGGLFMTCSCSGAIAQGDGLLPLVQEAALQSRRRLTLLRAGGASLDHPLDLAFPHGNYLTNLLFSVS